MNERIRKALEVLHPSKPKEDYLAHEPKGSAKKKIQKGWEDLHASGLTEAPEREETDD
jgi:hypothetical protein